ncbi:MAG: NTP transferase domain-containing protein [Verrucomicrobiaceae bacterium]|nr:NTP transferase domain-containing protein [Verrucomicrobiaceae bacterium]
MHNRYALILAGGSGERFWPLSRRATPKQLLKLFGRETLLQAALARLQGILPRENILVLTNVEQEEAVRELIAGQLPAENIVSEPAKRDTAAAIALAVGWVAARDPDAGMAVLPADHLIKDEAAFATTLNAAFSVAENSDAVVTLGIKPTWACPSYGYIERAGAVAIPGNDSDVPVFEVVRFREKPDVETAQEFLDAGNFSWNSGMFIWSLKTVISEFSRHVPALAQFVEEVRTTANLSALLEEKFCKLDKISIDFALMEKASRVLNIEASFQWDDVGSWISVARYLSADDEDNRSNARVFPVQAANNVVYCADEESHVALLGVEDLIVVQTGDALLVAHRDKADQIKGLTEGLPEKLL